MIAANSYDHSLCAWCVSVADAVHVSCKLVSSSAGLNLTFSESGPMFGERRSSEMWVIKYRWYISGTRWGILIVRTLGQYLCARPPLSRVIVASNGEKWGTDLQTCSVHRHDTLRHRHNIVLSSRTVLSAIQNLVCLAFFASECHLYWPMTMNVYCGRIGTTRNRRVVVNIWWWR
jgi:hypothetical protein